jgi:hypothetical protein
MHKQYQLNGAQIMKIKKVLNSLTVMEKMKMVIIGIFKIKKEQLGKNLTTNIK